MISPYVEVALRHIYWRNVDKLKRYSPYKATSPSKNNNATSADFEKVIEWLKDKGVGEGSLLIVHSGYGELERTGLSAERIIERMLELVGPTGTLAMPVIRKYKEFDKAEKAGLDLREITGKYNVKKTMVVSGMLPYTLMHHEGAVISHHPFNPLCAVGPLAKEMMEHNLDGEAPSPHGPNSCWRFCYDHGAQICSIGIDIEHHNTMLHVGEEGFGDWYWPDNVWYNQYTFEVVDENKNSRFVRVSNRKDRWGKQHLAGITLSEAEKKKDIMKTGNVDGITVGYVDSQKLISYLRSKNKKGYPYYVFPWENPKNFK